MGIINEAYLNDYQGILITIDNEAKIINVNEAFLSALGYTKNEVINSSILDFIVPDDHPLFTESMTLDKVNISLTVRLYQKQKDIHYFNINMVPFNGRVLLLGQAIKGDYKASMYESKTTDVILRTLFDSLEGDDITDILEFNESFELIVELIPIDLWIKDRFGRYIFCNKSYTYHTGNTLDEIYLKDDFSIFEHDIANAFLTSDKEAIDSRQVVTFSFESEKNNLLAHTKVTKVPVFNKQGAYIGIIGYSVDITEQKKRENEIVYLSYHDTLTKLYNRAYLEEETKRLDTARQLPFSIIMGDVNGLKLTNDIFGHDAGDELLKKVAESLMHVCRKEDIVGRWGGDEFVILLPQTTAEKAHIIMERIMSHFNHFSSKDMVNGIIPNISLGYGVKTDQSEDINDIMKVAETNMYKRKMLSKTSMHSKIIKSMETALHEKSDETQAHCNRLFKYCKSIAVAYGVDTEDIDDLELLCKLHDLGKIGVKDEILEKPGPLTDTEWTMMKRHPEIGYRIAQSTPELQNVARYILSHHEKYDGSGYPKGLKGKDIPLLSRILSVADAYDAMTTQRPYNVVKTKVDALKEIKANAGSHFDPEVVKIFLEMMESKVYDV